jgi:NAD(P)-dependent dehydrogenase (short-subunit alcohol dehydrogenase family)
MKRFQDKVAIITGAGRGLGAQYARDLAREGAIVSIWDINAANLEKVKLEIEAEGGRSITSVTDITNYDQVERAVSAVVSQFGRVDILINNAAYHKAQPVVETSNGRLERQIDTNLNGILLQSRSSVYAQPAVWENIEHCLGGRQILLSGICSLLSFKSGDC